MDNYLLCETALTIILVLILSKMFSRDTSPSPKSTISRFYGRRPKRAYLVSLWLDSGLPIGPD